jgi:tetratricopeptide (TPR) repeat protein
MPLAAYVFGAVFFLRLIVLARFTQSALFLPSRGDMHFYNDWALRILHGQWTDHLAFYGLPLYAYLLAALYKAFGYSPFIPALLQACLEAGTAAIVVELSVTIFKKEANPEPRGSCDEAAQWRAAAVGVAAAAGWAFFEPAQAYSVILMPAAWLVFVFWFVVWQVVKRQELPTAIVSALLGLLIGVTAMGIATIFFIVPLLLFAVLAKWSIPAGQSIAGRRLIAILAIAAGIAAGASPCWIHNYFVARDPVLLSAHGGINFWIGNNPVANGYPRFPPGLHAGQAAMLTDSISIAEEAAGKPLQRSQVSAYWSAQARSYIGQHFTAWLKLLLSKLRNFWNAFQYDDLSVIANLREQGVIFPGLRFGLVAALGIAGMGFAVVRFPASRWVAAAILLHMCSVLFVFVTERYRLAAVPGLLIFAAFGLWQLFHDCATARYKRAFAYLLVLGLAATFVSLPQRDPSLWALEAYNSGWQALESNDLTLAEQKLQLAYAYVPRNAETNFALGNLRLAQGERAQAASYYSETLQLEPAHSGALNNLAVMAIDAHDWATAERLLRDLLSHSSRNAKAHFLLAKVALGEGDSILALHEINLALKIIPAQPAFLALKKALEQKQ